jgi:hypothetical protein
MPPHFLFFEKAQILFHQCGKKILDLIAIHG